MKYIVFIIYFPKLAINGVINDIVNCYCGVVDGEVVDKLDVLDEVDYSIYYKGGKICNYYWNIRNQIPIEFISLLEQGVVKFKKIDPIPFSEDGNEVYYIDTNANAEKELLKLKNYDGK